MTSKLAFIAGSLVAFALIASAQENRPLSPRGSAAVHVLGRYVSTPGKSAPALGGADYRGGKWIEISYGRPLKNGRDLWGSSANYGKAALVGTPIWRAGADVSTQLKNEVPLVIGGKTFQPGVYTLFIDLKENKWTFVVSSWPAMEHWDPNNKTQLWGSYFYTPDKDLLRVPKLETQPHATEELTWEFLDMSASGGLMALRWDKILATVPFQFGE